jgi:hypothetical protein
MNKITVLKNIVIGALFSSALVAMEPHLIAPDIVDHNKGQAIKTMVDGDSIIGVFGGTPRYSAFEKYMSTLRRDYSDLMSQYSKNKRLKGVERSIRSFITAVEKCPGLEAFNSYITTAPRPELMKLFFAAGCDHNVLKENVGILLKTAQLELTKRRTTGTQPERLYLAHLLLPSYFTDLPHLKNDSDAKELLHTFLTESANFYKGLYEQSAHDPSLKVCVIIPRLQHFLSAVSQGDSLDKLKINTDVVQEELIESVGSGHGFVLLNQNYEQLTPLVNYLQQKGSSRVAGVGVPIYNKCGLPSTIFNPYTLKPDSKHSYQNSPLFNEQLLEYVQHTLKGEKHA